MNGLTDLPGGGDEVCEDGGDGLKAWGVAESRNVALCGDVITRCSWWCSGLASRRSGGSWSTEKWRWSSLSCKNGALLRLSGKTLFVARTGVALSWRSGENCRYIKCRSKGTGDGDLLRRSSASRSLESCSISRIRWSSSDTSSSGVACDADDDCGG